MEERRRRGYGVRRLEHVLREVGNKNSEDDEKLPSPSIQDNSAAGVVALIERNPDSSVALLASIREHASEMNPSPPPKRLRHLESTLEDTYSLTLPSNDDRVFETRLGDDKTVTFLFAPWTISLGNFFHRFCEVWKMEIEANFNDVGVRVCIAGAGEYRLSFGPDREKSWYCIMEMAEERPEFHILVTVGN